MRYCYTRALKLEFVILEVGNSRGDRVGGRRGRGSVVLNGALLLETSRYKLAWWLFIYQRLLCVKFVASVSSLSKWEEWVIISRLIVTCTTKKCWKKMHLSIIRYVVVCSCRYNFECLSCTYRRRVIRGARWARGKFKGTPRLIVDFTGKAGITMLMGGIFVTPIQIFECPLKTHLSKPEFCDESVSCCYVSSMSTVFEV